MFITDKVEKIDELHVSPFDIVRVLLPLIDAEISFNYGVATALPDTVVFLPRLMTDLARITATELWRRMWDGLDQTKYREKSSVLEGFLSCCFSMHLENPNFSGIRVIFQYTPKKRDSNKTFLAQKISKQIFSYAFHKMLQVRIGVSTYSDQSFQKILAARPLIIKPRTYDVNTFRQVVENLKWRFDFINWRQVRFLDETLSIDETIGLVRVLSSLRKKNNCVCVLRKSLEKKLAKEINKSRETAAKIIENLCNRKYTRLYPTFTDYLQSLRGRTSEIDENILEVLIKLDDLAGPYRGRNPLPFIEIRGFVFISLWLLHYLILEDIFEKTTALYLQRGFSLDKFTEKVLIADGFKAAKNVKWIKLDPPVDNKSRLEINVLAYQDRKLLLIQCKSYGKQKLKNKIYRINKQAKFWRQVADYLSRNLNLVLKKLQQDSELYKEIDENGVEMIYPLLITEVDDLGVVHGCRVINILKFLTEIYYIQTRNMWKDLVENREAISIRARTKFKGSSNCMHAKV